MYDTFGLQERGRDEDFSIKKDKNCANVGTKPIFASVLQCCSNCKIGILQTMDPTLHNKMMDLVNGCSSRMCTQTETDSCQLSVIVTAMSKARAKQEQQATRNFVKTDWSPYLANNFFESY